MIAVIDCGTSWLDEIQKNLDELGYHHKVIKLDDIKDFDFTSCSGIVISGSPILLTQVDLNKYLELFGFINTINIPVLGICLGHQIIGLLYGSKIDIGEMINKKEKITIVKKDELFIGVENNSLFQEEHSEFITLPDDFVLLAKSESCENEAMKHSSKKLYGLQFHPEVSGSSGEIIFRNFLGICEKNR